MSFSLIFYHSICIFLFFFFGTKISTTGMVKNIIHHGCHSPKQQPKTRYATTTKSGYIPKIPFGFRIIGIIGIAKNTIQPGCHASAKNPINKYAISVSIGVAAIIFFLILIFSPPLKQNFSLFSNIIQYSS